MTNQFSKRKYAGPTVAELRKVDQVPLRVPPHKKPKVWTLTVRWTETTTREATKQFTSRAARDEARVRLERHFREEAERQKSAKRYRYWPGWTNSPLYQFDEVERKAIKTGPEYIEGYSDMPSDNSRPEHP